MRWQRATESIFHSSASVGGCLPVLLCLPAPGRSRRSAGWGCSEAVSTQVSCGSATPARGSACQAHREPDRGAVTSAAWSLPTGSGMFPAPSQRRGPPRRNLIRKSPLAWVSAFNRQSFMDRGEEVLLVDFYSPGSGRPFVDKWLRAIFP